MIPSPPHLWDKICNVEKNSSECYRAQNYSAPCQVVKCISKFGSVNYNFVNHTTEYTYQANEVKTKIYFLKNVSGVLYNIVKKYISHYTGKFCPQIP